MSTPTLKDPNIVTDNDGPKLHNEVLPTKTSQLSTVEFAKKWDKALQTSIKTRSDRHKADTKLKDKEPHKSDADWQKRFKDHEERLDRELAAIEVVNEYLAKMQESS